MWLGFGLLLTYTRALWIAAAVALGLVLIALFPAYKAHLIRYLLIGIPVLLLLFGLLGAVPKQSTSSELVTASTARFLSILAPEETLESYSLQWRVFETEEGLRSVSEHPLVGVGLGNSYREVTTLAGEAIGLDDRRQPGGRRDLTLYTVSPQQLSVYCRQDGTAGPGLFPVVLRGACGQQRAALQASIRGAIQSDRPGGAGWLCGPDGMVCFSTSISCRQRAQPSSVSWPD